MNYLLHNEIARLPKEITNDLFMSNNLLRYFQIEQEEFTAIKYHTNIMIKKKRTYREYEMMMSIAPYILNSHNHYIDFGMFFDDVSNRTENNLKLRFGYEMKSTTLPIV